MPSPPQKNKKNGWIFVPQLKVKSLIFEGLSFRGGCGLPQAKDLHTD